MFDALLGPGYAYLYWDRIDAVGHGHGPDSRDTAASAALDALEAGVRAVPDALLLVTADHGQVAVDRTRVDFLDELWPELPGFLRGRPAGSARDVFLHTLPGAAGEVAERLGRRAEVRPVADLIAAGAFGNAGPRLRARLADVCVLPSAGWYGCARPPRPSTATAATIPTRGRRGSARWSCEARRHGPGRCRMRLPIADAARTLSPATLALLHCAICDSRPEISRAVGPASQRWRAAHGCLLATGALG